MLSAHLIRAHVGLETTIEGFTLCLKELEERPEDPVTEAEIAVVEELLGRVLDAHRDFSLYQQVVDGEDISFDKDKVEDDP
jgi:hypothetical protein